MVLIALVLGLVPLTTMVNAHLAAFAPGMWCMNVSLPLISSLVNPYIDISQGTDGKHAAHNTAPVLPLFNQPFAGWWCKCLRTLLTIINLTMRQFKVSPALVRFKFLPNSQ